MSEGLICNSKQGWRSPRYVLPPPTPHPFNNQANISLSYFPEPGRALVQLLPCHTPLLSNPDGTEQRTTCCVTQLKEEKIDSHRATAMPGMLRRWSPVPPPTHTGLQTRKLRQITSTSSLKQGLHITLISAVTKWLEGQGSKGYRCTHKLCKLLPALQTAS